MEPVLPFETVELSSSGREVIIMDQTLLPHQEKYLHLTTAEQVFYAITLLKVRGGSAIGTLAAMGLAVCINRFRTKSVADLEKEFFRVKKYLYISRPSATGLMWSLDRMENRFQTALSESGDGTPDAVKTIKRALLDEAESIKKDDIEIWASLSEYGFPLLFPGVSVLTQGGTGNLSVSRYGSLFRPLYLALQKGYAPKVYVNETRPLLGGARYEAYELMKSGVDTTLLCDNAVLSLMQQRKIDFVFTGAERIAANGDCKNSVGTATLAVLAYHCRIPFYVLAPYSTIDFNCNDGNEMELEMRPSYEVTDMYYGKPMAPKGIEVYNPAFDITPAGLITGIITEKGILRPEELKNRRI